MNTQQFHPEIILAVDPGTIVTGYGVISTEANGDYRAIDYGCIKPPPHLKLSDRYLIIFDSLEYLLEKHKPQILVVETQYMKKNIQSAIKLGMARGIAIIAAKKRGLAVYEYAPTQAKLAVCCGQANKEQVQKMVQVILKLTKPPTPTDASDALSLAICHAKNRQKKEI